MPDFQAPLKFILIRRDNIGDLVCTTPMLHALRRHYPKATVAALVNSYNAAILENNPDVDRVYAYEKAKHTADWRRATAALWRRVLLLQKLRREKFDYAIIAGANFLPRALRLARTIRPRHIVGFVNEDGTGKNKIDIAMPYTLARPMHEVEDIFRLLAPLGISGEPPRMWVHPAAEARRAAAHALSQAWGTATGPVVAVHISARKPSNRWVETRYGELIHAIHGAYGARIVLLWSPGEETNPRHPGDDNKARRIMAGLRDIPICGYPTQALSELIAAIALADFMVCSDGGALHIAAALNRPTLCFFGDSDAHRWRPWMTAHELLQPQSLNVADVTVVDALAAFQRLVEGSAR